MKGNGKNDKIKQFNISTREHNDIEKLMNRPSLIHSTTLLPENRWLGKCLKIIKLLYQ